MYAGELAEGQALAEAGSAEAEELDLYPLARQALSVLAMARAIGGDLDGERRAYEARLGVVRAKSDLDGTADTLGILAEIALDDADGETAAAFASEALAIAATRLPPVARDATITLARIALLRGDLPEAGRQVGVALELSDRLGQGLAVAQCLRVGACLAVARGEAATAARLFAAAHVRVTDARRRRDPLRAGPCGRSRRGPGRARRGGVPARVAARRRAAAALDPRPAGLAARRRERGGAQLARLRASVAASRSLVHSAPNRSRPDGSAAHSKEAGVAGSGSKLSRTSGRSGSAPLFSSRK